MSRFMSQAGVCRASMDLQRADATVIGISSEAIRSL
jgi:hypothetical protein